MAERGGHLKNAKAAVKRNLHGVEAGAHCTIVIRICVGAQLVNWSDKCER